jgi:hypothetical protein
MTHWSRLCYAAFFFPLQMAVELLLGDWDEVSPGCIIVTLFHESIEPATFLLTA